MADAVAIRDANRNPALQAISSVSGSLVNLTSTPISGVNPLNVAIVDGSGTQITSFGGGTQYTDAGTPPAHPVGGTLEWNNAGAWATVGSAAPLPISLYLGTSAVTLGQQTAGNSIPVILPSATITTLTPPSNAGYALDASLTTLNTSVNTLLKPASTLAAVTTVSAVTAITNALPAGTNLLGKVGIDQTIPGTTNAMSLAQINAATTLAGNGVTGTGAQRVTLASDNTAIANWGLGATGSAVPSGAQYDGGIAKTALPTAASDGNLTGKMVDKFGRQVVVPNGMRDIILPMTQLTLTASTTETSLIAAVASTFLDLLSIVVINTSATATQVDFRDSTGGTIRLSLYVPAGDTRGIVFNTPLPQAAVNTVWTAKCGTSVSSVIITGTYITNK